MLPSAYNTPFFRPPTFKSITAIRKRTMYNSIEVSIFFPPSTSCCYDELCCCSFFRRWLHCHRRLLHSTRKTQICARAIAPAVCNFCDLLSIRMWFVSRYWCSMLENAFRLLFSYVSFDSVEEIRNRSW